MIFLHGACATLLVALSSVPPAPSRPPTPQTAPVEGVRQLDPRIAVERVTESTPAPPPREIVQPIPPVHRIAPEHSPLLHVDAARFDLARAAIDRGLAYLASVQTPAGAWMSEATAAPTDQPARPEPVALAVTALAIKAFAQAQRDGEPTPPALDRALRLLLASRRPDGTFGGEAMSTYVHSCIAMGLSSVQGLDVAEALQSTVELLLASQWDSGEGLSPRQDWYGGAGYGRHGRPDLSNTQMMLDALHDAGISADDPAVQRAVVFLSRAQNVKATNDSPWAQAGSDDGGFVYTPANGGESFASEAAGEGRYGEIVPEGAARSLRSYGSMTYAGFKSMVYAGLPRDDIRVRAAYDWIRRNLTFDENPGLGLQGLYYYRHAMARALHAGQQPTIEPLASAALSPADDTAPGSDAPAAGSASPDAGSASPDAESTSPAAPDSVNWRAALIDALVDDQRRDGSWVNGAERWMEGSPQLATIFAVLALEECLK